MRFGIHTLDEFDVAGKTVLCRVDMNQPVDRQTDTLKSTARIEACVPTLRELSDKGAKLVVLAHQGSDIEYKNFYCTRPHAKVLAQLLDRPVRWIDDVCGPTARQMIRELKGEPVGCAFIIELEDLHGREVLSDLEVLSLRPGCT